MRLKAAEYETHTQELKQLENGHKAKYSKQLDK